MSVKTNECVGFRVSVPWSQSKPVSVVMCAPFLGPLGQTWGAAPSRWLDSSNPVVLTQVTVTGPGVG